MKTSFVRLVPIACTAVFSVACSHNAAPELDPVAIEALHADLVMAGSESTWVTNGNGYELVGRTRAELAQVKPSLDRAAAFLAQIYPRDSIAPIVATIRRFPASLNESAVPLPPNARGTQVELVIVDQQAFEKERKESGNRPPVGGPRETPGMRRGALATPAVRAWLAARATRVSGTSAQADGPRGGDLRVPAWAVDMISNAGDEEFIDNSTKSLAEHPETLIPLDVYFTMPRPDPLESVGDRRGGARPNPDGRGGAGEGDRGGAGGRGGMGGRGGGGRGFPGGRPPGDGGQGEPRSGARSVPLQGAALFIAQSAVLAKYFARTQIDAIGNLIDAQIKGTPIEDLFAKYNLGSVEQVDADWRSWLTQRADMLNRQ